MAKPLDQKEIVPIQEIAISNMLEIEALVKPGGKIRRIKRV
jgi:hypothetical protein